MASMNEYRPKFCRTRGCTFKFEHDGAHSIPTPKPGPAPTSRKRRGNPQASGAGSSLPKVQARGSVRHVNANPRGHATRAHMAQIRAGRLHGGSPAPLPTVKAVSRRQQILARRSS